jgi:cytochrome c-type biogenesis protein CcmF
MAWKRGDIVAVTQRLAGAAALTLLVAIVFFFLTGAHVSLAPLGLLLGFWAAFGALAELVDRARFGRISFGQSLRRLVGLPRTAFSTALAHFGIGITVIGIVATTAWQSELITTIGAGETVALSGYSVTLDRLDEDQPGPNYTADRGTFTITDGGNTRTATAERRIYTANGQPTTEASIQTYGFSQLYIQLGEDQADGRHVLRLWYKPFVTFIWLGAVLMALAGFVSLSDRRLRVGAPRRATAAVPAPGAAE